MDMEVAAFVIVAVGVFFVWKQTNRRFEEMEQTIASLRRDNEALQKRMEQEVQEAAASEPAAAPAAMSEEPAAEPRPMVPVGSRQPVVVAPRPMVAIETPAQDKSAEAELDPEVVAVIMAAVAACGYSPAAIRSIRPQKQSVSQWVLAGRLARMRQ
ncbi:hypothetical protein [uncultured Megasphaera sp.]|uniref:hypothetical protein n=1 Tax=uncultured Megasphaera sp. TaxID=165188 RepID=UPI00265B18F8|nr:hypothetical protein [uncultured Megasphaera sp.]